MCGGLILQHHICLTVNYMYVGSNWRCMGVRRVNTVILLSRPYSIKPNMSREQRLVEAVLLQERWHLIQSGVARNSIKIQNTRLFVKNKLHGQFINLSSQSDTRMLLM